MKETIEARRMPEEYRECPPAPFAPAMTQRRSLEQDHRVSALLRGYLQNSPEALVFFDWRGEPLYKSAHGETLYNRWNRALGRGQAAASLPEALLGAFQDSEAPLNLQHPELPGLTAVLDTTPGGFVLRLMDDQTHAGTETLSALALATLKKLSLSEQRVARLAVEGLRNDQIAKRLCRSPRTIEFQLHCAFRKLGVSNRVQLSRLLS